MSGESSHTQTQVRIDAATSTWNSFQRALKFSEAKYVIWARLKTKNGLESPLPEDVLDAPVLLNNEIRNIGRLDRFDVFSNARYTSFLLRLIDEIDVAQDLIRAFDISRVNKSPSFGLSKFEFHKESIDTPLENIVLLEDLFPLVPKKERGPQFFYVCESRRRTILSDLENQVGIKVFRSAIPRFRVAMTTKDSLLSRSGLEPGDEILKLNGQVEKDPIEKLAQLSRIRKSEIWLLVKKQNGDIRNLVIKVPGF